MGPSLLAPPQCCLGSGCPFEKGHSFQQLTSGLDRQEDEQGSLFSMMRCGNGLLGLQLLLVASMDLPEA